MQFIFHGEIVDYEYFKKNNSENVIFLHGWGGNKFSFLTTINLLKNNYSVLTITIPTIANTNLVWDMFSYTKLVETICNLHNIKSACIVCHSFGFRIATLLKDKIKIKKIVVTGGAGMKKNNIFTKTTKNNNKILIKSEKFKYLYKKIASSDYQNLSNTNKQTFKNIVNYISNSLINFSCPLLLFWGKFDKETPLWIAKKLAKQNDANLINTTGSHFAYLDFNSKFNYEVLKFLK